MKIYFIENVIETILSLIIVSIDSTNYLYQQIIFPYLKVNMSTQECRD